MPTFERCDTSVERLARYLIEKYDTNKPLGIVGVKIDYVFAYGDVDEDGKQLNDALTKNGIKALGITRKIPLKDRALGRGDAEIALDGDWWKRAYWPGIAPTIEITAGGKSSGLMPIGAFAKAAAKRI